MRKNKKLKLKCITIIKYKCIVLWLKQGVEIFQKFTLMSFQKWPIIEVSSLPLWRKTHLFICYYLHPFCFTYRCIVLHRDIYRIFYHKALIYLLHVLERLCINTLMQHYCNLKIFLIIIITNRISALKLFKKN